MDRGSGAASLRVASRCGQDSYKILSLVLREYETYGVIVEKYDVVRARADISHDTRFGYTTNEIGFGRANAVFTALFDGLPPSRQQALLGISSNWAE